MPDQSDACTEYVTWAIQQACRTSLVTVLILSKAKPPVGWSNWLEEVELDLICMPNQATEASI